MQSILRLYLLSSLLGCAVTEPDINGHIVARCTIRSDGTATAIDQCPTGQTLRCLPGTDAGSGHSLGRCCPNEISDEVCAQRASLTDSGTPPADR